MLANIVPLDPGEHCKSAARALPAHRAVAVVNARGGFQDVTHGPTEASTFKFNSAAFLHRPSLALVIAEGSVARSACKNSASLKECGEVNHANGSEW